jgi:hypothetical protein
MSKFKTYTEFLNENIEINLAKDLRVQFRSIFKIAKKNKFLKNEYSESYRSDAMLSIFKNAPKITKSNLTYVSKDETYSKDVVAEAFCRTKNDKIYYFYLLAKYESKSWRWATDPENFNTLTIAVIGENSSKELSDDDMKELRLILPDEIKSTLGGYAGKSADIRIFNKPKFYDIKNSKYKGIVFDYSVEAIKGEKITPEMVLNTKAYKDFLKEYPCIKLASSTKQLKNGTILFGIDKGHVLDKNKKYIGDAPFFYKAFALTTRGYLRSMPTYDDPSFGGYNDQGSVISSFDSSTIKGWESGIEKIKEYFKKFITNMKKEDVFIFVTPEELHANRGRIIGTKFGL